jgi:7-cyano-7-deazaguanine synthase
MCSYVGFTCEVQTLRDLVSNREYIIEDFLDVKGSGEYCVKFKLVDSNVKFNFESYDYFEFINYIKLNLESFISCKKIDVIFFRRMAPEMENGKSKNLQPYFTEDNALVAVHGTIPLGDNHLELDVDTDIFLYNTFKESIEFVEESGGKISAIELKNGSLKTYHNGLGIYSYQVDDIEMYSNIYTHLEFKQGLEVKNNYTVFKNHKVRHIALFSAGLDITCSVYNILSNDFNHKSDILYLWYFDWGTVASQLEIENGKQFANNLVKQGYTVEYKVFDIQPAFRNILSICNVNARLIDNDATGAGTHEAESAISYVPYRNTTLLTMAASIAEQRFPNNRVNFIIGANLSEGMVYLDNSETFVRIMNDLVKVGGQDCHHFNVVAPYVNKTKTEMLKDFVNVNDEAITWTKDFSTIFSCYFPKDGKPCGKCGSCLLKNKSMERAFQDNEKE